MIQGKVKKIFFLTSRLLWLGFPFFKNSVKREAIKQTSTTFAGPSRPSKLRFAVWQHYTHQLSNGPSSTKSFIFDSLSFAKYWQELLHKKIKQQQKIYSRASPSNLALLQAEIMNCDRVSFHSAIFCLFVCFLCYHHSITINHTDPKSLALSRSERGPEFKTASF